MKTNQRCLYGFLLSLLLLNLSAAKSDEDHTRKPSGKARANAVSNQLYKEECGGCHMAYPPRFLPAGAWKKIINNLHDHYGDNAELPSDKHKEITLYLQNNSATVTTARTTGNGTLLRISTQPRFLHEHNEIPARLSTDNPQVKSFSNCAACHQRAEQGSFREHEVQIPGYGRWDD